MISIVSVYNNEGLLGEYLLRGLAHQTVEFEPITVDDTSAIAKTARIAEAFLPPAMFRS